MVALADPTVVAEAIKGLGLSLAGVQVSDGTLVDDNTWAWVQCFADFDYEYAYLVDVRRTGPAGTTSDYLAIFTGYDEHGNHTTRYTWWGHERRFPEVPDVYAAMAWWATWLKGSRDIAGRKAGS